MYADSQDRINDCVRVIGQTSKRIREIKEDMFLKYLDLGLEYDSESLDLVLFVNLEMKIKAQRRLEILENGGMA